MIAFPVRSLIIPHHSFSPDHGTLDSWGIIHFHTSYRIDFGIVTRADFYKRLYAGEKGYFQNPWRDVGYHYLIEKIGKRYFVIVGMPLHKKGIHCAGKNSISYGICFVGNYDREEPKTAMLQVAAKRVIVPLMAISKLTVDDIHPHSKYAKKSCPGKMFNLDTLRNIVKRLS